MRQSNYSSADNMGFGFAIGFYVALVTPGTFLRQAELNRHGITDTYREWPAAGFKLTTLIGNISIFQKYWFKFVKYPGEPSMCFQNIITLFHQ